MSSPHQWRLSQPSGSQALEALANAVKKGNRALIARVREVTITSHFREHYHFGLLPYRREMIHFKAALEQPTKLLTELGVPAFFKQADRNLVYAR